MNLPVSAAVVAGASGALGAAVARCLTERGFHVVATFCATEPVGATVPGMTWVRFDARRAATADAVADAVRSTGLPLSAVVYAIGSPSSKRRLADSPVEEAADLFTVNALGLVALWRAVAPAARSASARVVAVGSQATRALGAGNGPYSASKAALEAFALTLAKEEARHGVRVNVVAPSLIASAQAERILALKGVTDPQAHYRTLPWGRALDLAEVAEAVTHLAADPAWAYLSGQVLPLAADVPTSPAFGSEPS